MTSTRAPEARIAFGGKRTAKSDDWIFGTGLHVIYRHRRCQFGLTLRGRSDRRAQRQGGRPMLRSIRQKRANKSGFRTGRPAKPR